MRLDAHFDMLPERAFIRQPGGQILPQGGKGGGKAPPPDPSIGQAQLKLAELAELQYKDFQEKIWPDLMRQSEHQQAQADVWQKQQMDLADKNSAIADEYHNRMKDMFYPLQDRIVQDAMDYNTEGNFQTMANRAMGDVNAQNELARKNQAMQMAQYGINPASGAFTGANQAMNTMGAANAAAASNRAYTAAKELGWNLGMTASGLGAGLPGQQIASTGVAMNAGNGAMATGQMPIQNTMTLGNSMNQGYGGAMQGWGQYGNLGAQSYNTQVSAWSAQQAANAQRSAGLGSAIGGLIGMGMSGGTLGFQGSAIGMGLSKLSGGLSDVRAKQNIEFVGTLPSGLAVYEFEYRPEFRDNVLAGHGRFRGVMAQEALVTHPDAVIVLDDGYLAVDYSKVN
jgi:hypothetical protein